MKKFLSLSIAVVLSVAAVRFILPNLAKADSASEWTNCQGIDENNQKTDSTVEYRLISNDISYTLQLRPSVAGSNEGTIGSGWSIQNILLENRPVKISKVEVIANETEDIPTIRLGESAVSMFASNEFSDAESVDGLSHFDTSNCKDMSKMFEDGTEEDLAPAAKWNVFDVTSMACMFSGCVSLQNASALSNWEMNNETDLTDIFDECNALSSVGVPSGVDPEVFSSPIKETTWVLYSGIDKNPTEDNKLLTTHEMQPGNIYALPESIFELQTQTLGEGTINPIQSELNIRSSKNKIKIEPAEGLSVVSVKLDGKEMFSQLKEGVLTLDTSNGGKHILYAEFK